MEKKAKGPFDAAINCLSVMADRDFANGAPHRGQFRVAIRVLEVAGKTDKQQCQDLLDVLIGEDIIVAKGDIHAVRQFQALLDALPDAPEGGKG